MSEVTTAAPAAATSTENTGSEEVTTKDPDRWDDEPAEEAEESSGEQKKSEPAAKKKPTKEEAEKEEKKANEQRKRRLEKQVVDGKEELVDVDEALRQYNKNKAADKKFAEIAEARKSMEAFREQFERDPLSMLNNKNLPINRRELAERWMKEAIEDEIKDPTQKALEEKEAELNRYKEKELTEKQQAELREQNMKTDARRKELATVFQKAMEESVLSKDPAHAAEVLREMAMYARIAKQSDPDAPMPSPEELATHVENQRLKQYHSVARTLSGDQLIQFMGEEIVNKIRRADLDRIRKQKGMMDEPAEQQSGDSWAQKERQTKEKKFIDPVSMREITRKRLGL